MGGAAFPGDGLELFDFQAGDQPEVAVVKNGEVGTARNLVASGHTVDFDVGLGRTVGDVLVAAGQGFHLEEQGQDCQWQEATQQRV